MKFKISVILGFFGITSIYSQQSLNSGGGDVSSSTGSVAYSIGQVVFTTHNNNNIGSLAQGVQQAFEIFTSIVGDEINEISLSAFPNPAKDRLVLQVNAQKSLVLNYLLHDSEGRLLQGAKLADSRTEIDLVDLPGGVYFLQVQATGNQVLKTFTIIKKL
jgi:hypothetical protein